MTNEEPSQVAGNEAARAGEEVPPSVARSPVARSPFSASARRSDVTPPEEATTAFLNQLLAETDLGEDDITASQRSALWELAWTFRSQSELVLDPVGIELVDAMLRHRHPQLASDSLEWREMVTEIASTLFEDDHSRHQLQVFWNRLIEATQ